MKSSFINWLKAHYCDLFHGGGKIKRDPNDAINWQCNKCGRWSTPLSNFQKSIDKGHNK